ncbi:MAG: NAD(P)H-binding protein [bacterium]
MKVTVFGATGKAGSLVVKESVARGWDTTAFVRDAARIDGHAGVTVAQGDARSLDDVSRAVRGRDAVFVCLGMRDITVPSTEFSDGVKTIVRAMKASGVRRILLIASTVALPGPNAGFRGTAGLPEILYNVAAEHIRNYETLRDSGLEWTAMCPATLMEDIPVGHARFAYEALPPGKPEAGYADLARTMVDLLAEPRSMGMRVGLVSVR